MNVEEYRKKHQPIFQNQGRIGNINYCIGCKGPNDTLIQTWPCDVVELLDAWQDNTARAYETGFKRGWKVGFRRAKGKTK
jgi:hypothetical protein